MRENLAHYKGLRSDPQRDDATCAAFESILNRRITDWYSQPYNGSFQLTAPGDPIVWHSDTQDYAAAVYLSPGIDPSAGTSFWRHRGTGCRRSPWHPKESHRFSPNDVSAAHASMYNEYNFLHEDQWELVDRVAAAFNRCVIWDGRLVHSATGYPRERLVQLYFFNVATS